MSLAHLDGWLAFAIALSICSCGGGGGGTEPLGPPTQIVKSGGDGQTWYKNNPLPTPFSVTVLDANNRAVPGVSVDWAFTTGFDGSLNPDPSTTNASGVATTVLTLGTATTYVVTASASGVQTVATFNAMASAPPTSAAVAVQDFQFNPQDVVIKTGGTVTWTWGGQDFHDVTYDGGPTPRPASSGPPQTSGTHQNTITTVGRYTYHCSVHGNTTGSVTVVN